MSVNTRFWLKIVKKNIFLIFSHIYIVARAQHKSFIPTDGTQICKVYEAEIDERRYQYDMI